MSEFGRPGQASLTSCMLFHICDEFHYGLVIIGDDAAYLFVTQM